MCLAFFRFDPAHDWPFLLVSIRDEDLARPAAGAGAWWTDSHPGVVGGRDLQSGGTWLALDPNRRRVAAVYTPGAVGTATSAYRSRGELPLAALDVDELGELDLTVYLPFALLRADAADAVWWSWNGSDLERTRITPGMHAGNIDGLDATAHSPRQARWLPAFQRACPEPFHPTGHVGHAWGRWAELLDRGLEPDRDDALLVRRTAGHRGYGTRSVALVAIGRHEVRYDVCDRPGDALGWTSVVTGT